MKTGLYCAAPTRLVEAQALATQFALPLLDTEPQDDSYRLVLDETRLTLVNGGQHGAVFADFVEGGAAHRRQFGGGRGQPIARAVGIKGAQLPSIVDATAGLGRDAFVLASLGCTVILLERSPIAAALLADGLARARANTETSEIAARMTLVHAEAATWLTTLPPHAQPDVVYVDPMFPERGKAALAKKEMQAFQQVIGSDLDSARLLAAALISAKKRVVVKRPRLGAELTGVKPSIQMIGKSTRFDLYLLVR